MYQELIQSYGGSYRPDFPNQLISTDDICADTEYWMDIAPYAGPAVLLGRATLHLTRTSSMLRALSKKLEQDTILLGYQANQLAEHRLLLQIHQKYPYFLERGVITKWRAQIIAHLDSQIKALRQFEEALTTTQSVIAGLSPQIMGPFQSSSDVLGLSYGEYAPVDPCE